MNQYTYNGIKITLIGHASIKLEDNDKVIYFDPFANPDKNYEKKADLIFISHEHFDHCDPNVLKKITTPNTTIIAHPSCKEKIEKIEGEKIYLKAGDKINIKNITVDVVEAYNINKPYHPKGMGNGYVVKVNNTRFYHPGDTDHIEEMKLLKDKIDVFFCPISGTYVMDIDDGIEAVKDIMPKIVIPIHYNYLEGLEKDPEEFKEKIKERVPNVNVIILNP